MKKGFTLIELLVVIAIICILAAILFPVFAHAKEKAQQSTCASNEKQIGLAILQYVQDYDEHWPAYDRGVEDSVDYFWQIQVNPYIKGAGVWQCPDNKETLAGNGISEGSMKMIADYAGNINGFGGCGNPTPPPAANQGTWAPAAALGPGKSSAIGNGMFGGFSSPGIAQNQVLAPSSTIAVFEVDDLGSGANGFPEVMDNGCESASEFMYNIPHDGVSNYLFADGHVKALKPMYTVLGCDISGSNTPCTSGNNMWTRDNTLPVTTGILSTLRSAVAANR